MAEIAEMLLDVAKPLLEDYMDKDIIKFILVYANMAWNVSLIREKERPDVIAEMAEDALTFDGRNDREYAMNMLNRLVDRKLELYPNVHMFIDRFKIKSIKNEIRIKVKAKPSIVFE